MTNPCECMTFEDDYGQTVCRRCRGDYFACECPAHSRRCEEAAEDGAVLGLAAAGLVSLG